VVRARQLIKDAARRTNFVTERGWRASEDRRFRLMWSKDEIARRAQAIHLPNLPHDRANRADGAWIDESPTAASGRWSV
jgi:hypothetical protein